MDERPLFRDTDEAEAETEAYEDDVTDARPIVGGMGVHPGSGATGISSAGMAPPITAGAAQQAAEDVTAEDEADEEAATS